MGESWGHGRRDVGCGMSSEPPAGCRGVNCPCLGCVLCQVSLQSRACVAQGMVRQQSPAGSLQFVAVLR